eukprot:CAMPEP_0179871510 /NCGR_PEP_ID=MMETSP0982-20121206/20948_1 /TAXON_ID=483367 /ORGANISM="non described non described, Strain CCMP 2436" /LENGTH=37 /DNA_ID= /DNA_START= /DNA_END= /DNA_ORIENTATION=
MIQQVGFIHGLGRRQTLVPAAVVVEARLVTVIADAIG